MDYVQYGTVLWAVQCRISDLVIFDRILVFSLHHFISVQELMKYLQCVRICSIFMALIIDLPSLSNIQRPTSWLSLSLSQTRRQTVLVYF